MTRPGSQQLFAFISITFASCILISFFAIPNSIDAAAPASGNPVNGKALFEKRCTGCHTLDQNKEGPHLRGVYGRRAGSVGDFSYSDQLKASNFMWDDISLDKWLTNPDAVVPDNDMAFRVSNPQERADIIQFLRLSSGK